MKMLPVKTQEFVQKNATRLRKGAAVEGIVLVSDGFDSQTVSKRILCRLWVPLWLMNTIFMDSSDYF